MKKRALSLLIPAAMLLSVLSGCSSGEGNSGNKASSDTESSKSQPEAVVFDTQKHIVFENGGMKFYTPVNGIIQMTGTSTFHLLDKKNIESTVPIIIDPETRSIVHDGGTIYGLQKGESGIFSWDLSDVSYTERTTLYNTNDIKTLLTSEDEKIVSEGGMSLADAFGFMYEFKDGGDGYIYCIIAPENGTPWENTSISHRMIKYAKNGKGISFAGSEKADALSVKDDVVYYVPYNDDGKNGGSSVYKLNKDGSRGEEFIKAEQGEKIKELNIVDDSVYYIKSGNTDGDGRLYVKGLDGGESTRISDNTCLSYYVDKDKIYYIGGNNSLPTVYTRSLDDGSEKALFESGFNTEKVSMTYQNMTVEDDYLYFSSTGFELPVFIEDSKAEKDDQGIIKCPAVSGMRYNLSDETMECIYCYYLGTKDSKTGEILTAGSVSVDARTINAVRTDAESGLKIF